MKYQVCTKCVMDTTASEIIFDENGQCHFCKEFIQRHSQLDISNTSGLDRLVEQIKKDGKNKPYDCIVGVSGGIDSSYTLHLVKSLGLRPLAVHMDNGWNSELATNNILNLVRGVGVDLYTHVIDWQEYRDLMNSFFKADVIDVELLYDNAMLAVNFEQAKKYKVKYILSGSNSATEGIAMPKKWNWFKYDKKNILNIQKKFGTKKIKTMPLLSFISWVIAKAVLKIQWVPFLDYFDYNKNEAVKILQEKYNYKPYPYKHYESIFTRFYQGHILPKKFGVDKRKLHLSTLVATQQLSRDEALKTLEAMPSFSQAELDADIEFFLKKMKWTKEDLLIYLSRPEVPHETYGSEVGLFKKVMALRQFLKNKCTPK